MKSFSACLLVLATATNALVLPAATIAKRDECTEGTYQCQPDGQHWQMCGSGKVWASMMPVAPGTKCNPGISANPFIPVDGASAPAAGSQPAATSAVPAPDANLGGGRGGGWGGHHSWSAPAGAPPAPTPTPAASTPPPPPPPPPPAVTSTTDAAPAATSDSAPPPPPPAASSTTNAAPAATSDAPPPPPQATTNPNAGSGAPITESCFEFTSDDPSWNYQMAGGVWGTGSGTFGSLPGGKLCVPASDNGGGGAMFIGAESNPSAGNTKLECYFPTTGTANCDVSLVDGYSLSVECTTPTVIANKLTIGTGMDLWKQDGITCADQQGSKCLNPTAGIMSNHEAAMPDFFQAAGKDNTCIVWDCNQDYFFPVTETVTCHVSGSVPSSS